VSGKFC